MEVNWFFSNIKENEKNKDIIENIKQYVTNNSNTQIYLITSPLWENKYKYSYEENVIVILSPKYKIIFLDLNDGNEDFNDYYDEFIEDLWSISDKFNYKEYIGRPKDWKKEITTKFSIKDNTPKFSLNPFNKTPKNNNFSISDILEKNRLEPLLQRKSELLISLLVWSVNDLWKIWAEEPETLLEKIKNKIVLFDWDQTRFIYEEKRKKDIYIQWLAWTGKTELLLHKLKEIYLSSDTSKIFFTCKNIALSRELNKRIPEFFNFMKVEKQIEKNKRLWVTNAWWSLSDINSGLYRYICNFYDLQFFTFWQVSSFEKVINYTLEEIKKIDKDSFKFAFDYILIDESQDFPDNFFELCKIITKEQVYIAWDLFQDIFNNHIDNREIKPDYILNKCYRTDPKTLMFAQSIWMGLFETPHLNWLNDTSWKDIWYKIKKEWKNVYLSREPIRRFDDLDVWEYSSMNIIEVKDNYTSDIIKIINQLIETNPTITANDIWIIYLDDDYKFLCSFANNLEFELASNLKWWLNKAYETKEKINNEIFISNKNHVKGLEFPFVICFTNKILDNYSYRNTLYTMLTRSFLQSYLLVKNNSNLEVLKEWLKIINDEKCIKTIEPTPEELEKIKETIISYKKTEKLSYRDFIANLISELKIEEEIDVVIKFLSGTKYNNSFDEEWIKDFLNNNKTYL